MSDTDSVRHLKRAQMALDGELDAANQQAFEDDLARNPELAKAYESVAAVRAALRAHAPRERAPEALRARIEAMAAPPARTRAPRRWVAPAWAAALAFAAALAGYSAGRDGGDSETDALVAGYQRAALSGQPIDVASSDRHTVKPWLASRAPLGSSAPDLAQDGYPLLGGRLDVVGGRPAPTLVYRRREHLISVTELPLADARDGARAHDGYHVLGWRDAERSYFAISDMDADELATFAARFRAAAGQGEVK